MFGLVSNIVRSFGRTLQPTLNFRQFHALSTTISSKEIVKPEISNAWSFNSLRTIIRDHFKNPSEYKRLKRHGWRAKLKTRGGRRQIMRRILKGRYYITH